MGIFDKYFNSFKKSQKREVEKMLNSDVFNIKLSEVKNSKFEVKEYTKEEVDELILKEYDKNSFQDELRRNIKPQVIDNMNERLDGKTIDEVENERKEEIKKKARNLEDPEKLINELEDEEKENDNTEDKDSIALRSEAIKSIYLAAAEEYYKIVNDLQVGQNGQIYTGSIVNGTKMDNKLIMYQVYLKKLDLWYRNANHGMPIGLDEDVQEFLQEKEYKKEKNDSITNYVRENQVDRIVKLQDQLDNIENEMIKISNLVNDNPENAERLMALKKEYNEKRCELAKVRPSIGILHAEYLQKQKVDEAIERKSFRNEDKYDGMIYDQKTKSLDNKNDYIEEKNENTTEEVVHDKLLNENLIQSEEALQKFDEEYNNGNIEDALESLITAKSLIGTVNETLENVDTDNQVFEQAKSEIEQAKQERLERERDARMGIGAVYSDEEILSHDVNAAIMGIRDKVKEDIEKAKASSERVR